MSENGKKSRPSEVIVVGILIILLGAVWLAVGSLLGTFLSLGSPKAGGGFFLIFAVIALFLWLIAAGLFTVKSWAHTLALILSAISLINFPFGTVLGAICIWLLLKGEVKEAFGKG